MDDRLHLIDLDQPLPGQRRFISCWVWRTPELTFVVDPGPAGTADALLAALDDLGVTRLDLILLTHVHLDHAGCTARVLARWPEAKVVCHPRGRPHLADPSRLWAGSLKVLGRKAEVYGQPAPVAESALASDEIQAAHGLTVIDTPGHAAHHQSFLHDGNLYLGEAAGTFSTLGQGPETLDYYLRPATPPRFLPEVYQRSVGALLALGDQVERLCFAHHGQHTADPVGVLTAARDQVALWVSLADLFCGRQGGPEALLAADHGAGHFEALADVLAAADPHFARRDRLPVDIRQREQDFTRQTLRGILGHLAAR